MKVQLPYNCGLGPALNVIAGKWKTVILWELRRGVRQDTTARDRVAP